MTIPTRPPRAFRDASLALRQQQGSNALFGNAEGFGFGVLERNIIRALYRHRLLITLCFLVVTALVVLIVKGLPATYEAEANILIRTETQGNPSFLSGVAAVGPRTGMDSPERRLETEMQIAASRTVVTAAVQETKVEYDQVYHAPLTHILSPAIQVYEWAGQKWFGFPPSDRKGEASIVDAVQKALVVGPVKNKSAEVTSNLIVLRLPATSPEIARDLLASIVQQYLALQNGLASREVATALDAVRREQIQATRQADSARLQLRQFLAGSPRAAASGGIASASAEAIDRLRTTLLDAELKLGDARNVFREESDTIMRLNVRIATIRRQLSAEAGQSASADTRAEDLRARLRAAELREAELTRKASEIMLLSQASPLVTSDRMLIDAPLLPRSSDWKKRAALLVAGMIGGVLLGLLIAGVLHMMDHGLHSADDVRLALGDAPLGVVPRTNSAKTQAAMHALALRIHAALEAEPFREETHRANKARVILITSSRPGEGRTFVAQGLGRQLGTMQGLRVQLLDARSFTSELMAESRRSVSVVPAVTEGPVTRSLGEIDTIGLAQPTLVGTSVQPWVSPITGAAAHHTFLIIDGSDLPSGEADELAQQADLVLLVVDASRTGRQTVLDSLQYLATISAQPVGVVLNRTERDLPPWLLDRL